MDLKIGCCAGWRKGERSGDGGFRQQNKSEKLTSTVERHTACSSHIVVLQALLLDQLLSGEITSCKEHRSRHALSEQRTGCEPSIVPELQMVRTNKK